MSEFDIIARHSFPDDYAFIFRTFLFETLLAANFSKSIIQRMLMRGYVRTSVNYMETRRAPIREAIDEKIKEHYKHKGTIDHEDYSMAVMFLAQTMSEVGRFLSNRHYTPDQHGRVAHMLADFLRHMGASEDVAEQARLDVLAEMTT